MHPYFPFLMHSYFPKIEHICFLVTQSGYFLRLVNRLERNYPDCQKFSCSSERIVPYQLLQ